jgi:hypothetical protein
MNAPGAGATGNAIEARSDFKDTPRGQHAYWQEELAAFKRRARKWHKQGDKIVRRYLAKTGTNAGTDDRTQKSNLNLFHSNTITLQSMLYGQTPRVNISRRYMDAKDDVARVAADILDRLVNTDLSSNGKEYDSVFKASLEDRLLPGLGCARVRYTADIQEVTVIDENGNERTVKQLVSEDAPIDYYHWRDVAWGWGRTFADLPWIGFRSYLDKDEMKDRFGDEIAEKAEYNVQNVNTEESSHDETDLNSAWAKAEVWEIWDKLKKNVVWIVKGCDKVADTKPDPLKLGGFYPCPPFMLANPTTSLYMPTPDFTMAQDLYNEIDILQTRISIITEAVKVVGCYDSSAKEISRMFKEGMENDLIPVDNWALFAERGGIQGSVVWVPLQDIVAALDKLRELRSETIGLLQQVTGMSDIMRGELGGQYEGVGQSQLKAKFGSVRVQSLQDCFAGFVTDILQIKAEVIAKHFSAQTIYARSNVQHTFNAEEAQQGIALIKDPQGLKLRIEVKPESLAMIDYTMIKEERGAFLDAIAMFMQSAGRLMQDDPTMKPFLLQLLQWGLAGFKGSGEIEGVVDKAIEAAQEQAQQDKPDPEQQRMEMQNQIEAMKHKAEMEKIQAKAQADMQIRTHDLQADVATARAQSEAKIQEIKADLEASLAEIAAKAQADIQTEQVQSAVNAQQTAAAAEQEIVKSVAEHEMDLEQKAVEHQMELDKLAKADTETNTDD